jgi:predicted metal-binding membrane protein
VNVVRTTDARRLEWHVAATDTAAASRRREVSTTSLSTAASRRVFFGVCASLFIASAALMAVACVSMSAMGETPMPGGWSMSMTWSRMCGQTWPRAAASFIGMWIVMMVAMMLPSLAPMLWRYHETAGRLGHSRAGRLTACVGLGYFMVWAALGAAVFPPGAALAGLAMQWPAFARSVPVAIGAAVLIAGMLQFSAWKARHLACCRDTLHCVVEQGRAPAAADAAHAWRHGLRHGLHCACCCAGSTAALLAAGMMDLRVMAAVTAAITAERLAPNGGRIARVIGAVVVAIGVVMLAHAFVRGAIAIAPR